MLGWRTARGRAVLASAVFMLLLATVAGIAVWRVHDDQQRNERLDRRSTVVTALDDARAQLYLGAAWVASSAIADDPALFYDLNRQAEQALRASLAQARTELVALGEANELASLDDTSRQIDDLVQELDVLWEFSLTAESDARIETAQAELDRLWPRAVVVMADLGQLAEDQQSELGDERAAADRATNVTLWLLVGFSAAALVTGAAAVTTIGVSVARPLASLRASAQAIASGNLRLRARVSGPEEVASLARDINTMTEALLERREGLRNSHREYPCLFEDLTDAAFVADADTGILLDTNRQAEALLGRTRDEIIGMHQSELHPPGKAEEYKQRFGAHVEKAREADYDGEVVTKDGRLVPVSISATTTAVVNGKRLTIGLFRDITERRRAEQALRESEERFRSVLDVSRDVIYKHNLQTGAYDYISPSVLPLTGFTPEEFVALGSDEIQRRFHPEDRERAMAHLDRLLSQRAEDSALPTIQYRWKRKDGQYRWLSDNRVLIRDDNGQPMARVGTIRDITEYKSSEEALRQSEERFRGLAEATFEGILIHEAGTILETNEAFARMFGYELSEVTGMNALDLATPESREVIWQNIVSDYEGPYEATALRKDGKPVFVEIRGKSISYGGRVVRVAAIRDITERKRAEEALRQEKDFAENLIASMQDGFSILDSRGAHVDVNAAFCRMTGFSRDELIGTGLPHPYWPPEGQKAIEEALQKTLRGECNDLELTFMRKNGQRFPVILSPSCLKGNEGNVVSYFATVKDITERKRAEEALQESERRFRDISENEIEWIWEVGADGRYTYASPVVERILGYKPEEVLEEHFYDLFHPEDREELKRAAFEVFASKQPFREFVNRTVHKNGRIVWLSTSGVPMLDENGTLLGYRGADTDITERKRAEEALRESEERFRRLSESAFEGIAIHDKGRILDGNQAFATMFGYEISEVIGMSATDLAAPESRDLVSQSILAGRKEPLETVGLRKDGSTFPCVLRARAMPYGGRTVSVTALRDISELKQAEEERQKAREELEARVEHRMQRGNPYGLTFRELTVLHLVAAGRADKEIGRELGISVQTAHKHLANILSKMGAASRTEAGVRALREGLLD
jgi:PAS domain S-box-containing protein